MQPRTARQPVTRRRTETRQRLLEAARDVFAEVGFGRSTVEQICERAGFTRGAFYSNFTSLDELFLEMWAQESIRLRTDLSAAVTRARTRKAIASGDLDSVVTELLRAVPLDDHWYRISAEFSAHALRSPALRRVVVGREAAIVDTLVPLVETALEAAGRTATDVHELCEALVAIHDGTALQCLMAPHDSAAKRRRHDLFVRVINSYLTPTVNG